MSLEFFRKFFAFVLIALALSYIETKALEYGPDSKSVEAEIIFFTSKAELLSKIDTNLSTFNLFANSNVDGETLFIEDRSNEDNLLLFERGLDTDTAPPPVQTEQNQTNTLEFDSTESESQIPLLPQNISFMENALWGESGLFRSIGITSPLTPEQRQKELGWRRTFLTLHQTSGLITWGLMAGSVALGQLWLDGRLESPVWHRRLVYSTIATYSITGLLAIITPPPFERRDEFSTISFHKLAAWIHFAGMIATPILGRITRSSNDYYKSARIHQKVAYITFSVYSIAMLSIILFD
jgi:hypothetical protein